VTTTFAQLGVPSQLVDALAENGIVEPFPVQSATIPDALAGRDVCGKAPTGSGKTFAFGLPLLARVEKAKKGRPRALVLAPTRELAEQIKKELDPLARRIGRQVAAVYGGVGYGGQISAMRRGVDVLVACPGRLEDLIEQGIVDLSDADLVVLDEADRMADMGFMPSVMRLLDQTSSKRQTLLFSATLDGDIAKLSKRYQNDPVRHETASVDTDELDAVHHFWLVDHHDRTQHTADLINEAGKSIVFTRTRHGADRLAKQLDKLGVRSVAMHGGRSQNQRQRALDAFASGKAKALIATDVAARGIHVDDVASVIHFDPAGDHKDYLHRSGRTARAGATGTVVTLVTHEQKRDVLKMQREINIDAPFARPDVASLADSGHRIGDSSVTASRPSRERRDEGPRPERSKRSASPRNGGANRVERHERPAPAAANGSQRVYVANLPWTTTDQDLASMFARYGSVDGAAVVTNRKTGRSKGFGFVEMHADAAGDAIKALNGSSVGGRDLLVKVARPRN
jgi:superfamily II DNA/RNA helicase